MNKDYKVVFFGTDAEGDRKIQVMSQVQRILKLSEHHLVSLFDKPDGIDLYQTSDKDKAEILIRKLIHAGARAKLVDTRAPRREKPDDWELVDKTENTSHVFYCQACNHSERLPLTQPLPAICPECGVVVAKYQDVARKKRERERIRKSVINLEKVKTEKAEAEAERAREAALRKQIELEVRRELGVTTPIVRRIRGIAATAAVFTVGMLSTMGLEAYRSSVDPTPQTAQRETPTPTLGLDEQEQTIAHANTLISTLTGSDWQQMPEMPPGPAPPTVDHEPWVNAPPTAAGDASQPESNLLRSDAAYGAPTNGNFNSDDISKFVDAWYDGDVGDPLDLLRLRHLAGDLLVAGHPDEALSTVAWVDQPEQRMMLLQHISTQAAQSIDESPKTRLSDRLIAMADGEGSASEQVPVLLALDNLLKDRPGSDLRPDSQARLLQLINGSQIAASDAVALHALVAVQRSHNSGPDAAGFWFAEANQAFDRIQDPVDQLVALAVLARAYQAAGNQRTAERLVRRIKAGSDVLDEASPNRMRVIDRLVNAYIAIGHIDPALALVEQSASTALDVDLQRAQVAIELAAAHRFTSARGAVVLIANPVVRARAKARLSAIAALQEQLTIAQVLANEAMVEMRRLPQAEQALLASDMMPPLPAGITHLWTEEAIEKRVRHDEYPDRGWAIVATNLAWNRSGTAAEKLSMKIADEKLRKQTQQRIHELGMLFETAATIPAG